MIAVATGCGAGCAAAVLVVLLARRWDPAEVSSQGMAAFVTLVAAGLLIGAHWHSLVELYDYSSTHGHAASFASVGWTSAVMHGGVGLVAAGTLVIGEAFITYGRIERLEVSGLGNLVWIGLTWWLAVLFLVDPAHGPRNGQLLELGIALGAGALVMIAVRLVWGVTLKTGIRWQAPSPGAAFGAPDPLEVWVTPGSQGAFVLLDALEGYARLLSEESTPARKRDIAVGLRAQLERTRRRYHRVVVALAGSGMGVVTFLARAGSAQSYSSTEAALLLGVTLALLWLVAHVARPAGVLEALEDLVPRSEPPPPELVAVPHFPVAPLDELRARVRASVPATHEVTCRSCGGRGGETVVVRTTTSAHYTSGFLPNDPAAVNAGYAPPSSPGQVLAPGGTHEHKEWLPCQHCDGTGRVTKEVSAEEATQLASRLASMLSECQAAEDRIRRAVMAENERRVAEWRVAKEAWLLR